MPSTFARCSLLANAFAVDDRGDSIFVVSTSEAEIELARESGRWVVKAISLSRSGP